MNGDTFRYDIKLAPLFGKLTDEQKGKFHKIFPDGIDSKKDFRQAERLIATTIRKNEGICQEGGPKGD